MTMFQSWSIQHSRLRDVLKLSVFLAKYRLEFKIWNSPKKIPVIVEHSGNLYMSNYWVLDDFWINNDVSKLADATMSLMGIGCIYLESIVGLFEQWLIAG